MWRLRLHCAPLAGLAWPNTALPLHRLLLSVYCRTAWLHDGLSARELSQSTWEEERWQQSCHHSQLVPPGGRPLLCLAGCGLLCLQIPVVMQQRWQLLCAEGSLELHAGAS